MYNLASSLHYDTINAYIVVRILHLFSLFIRDFERLKGEGVFLILIAKLKCGTPERRSSAAKHGFDRNISPKDLHAL